MAFWIKYYLDLPSHPKTNILQINLGTDLPNTIYYLLSFWEWVYKYAESGFIDRFDPLVIGQAVTKNMEMAKIFVPAMIKAGFIDTDPLRAHGCMEVYDRNLVNKYNRHPERVKSIHEQWKGLVQVKQRKKAVVPVNGNGEEPDAEIPKSKTNQQLIIEHFATVRKIDISNKAAANRFFKENSAAAIELNNLSEGNLEISTQAIDEIADYLDELINKGKIQDWRHLSAIVNSYLEWFAAYKKDMESSNVIS